MRLEGPEYVSDDELLHRAVAREDKLQWTVWELDGKVTQLERERDEASKAESASRLAYEELEEACRKERAAHRRTRRLALRLGLFAAVLLVLLIGSVLLRWFVLR